MRLIGQIAFIIVMVVLTPFVWAIHFICCIPEIIEGYRRGRTARRV